jgi:hypothetical protein
MSQLSQAALGVVALIGEAEGGGAGGGATEVECTVPQDLLDNYRTGPLRDMGLFAFDPSKDSRAGGARKVLCYKVNPALQGSVILASGDGNALRVEALDYGQFTNRINVEKSLDGALPTGTAEFQVHFEDEDELYEEIGGDPWLDLTYSNLGGLGYTTAGLQVGRDGSLNPDRIYVETSKGPLTGEGTSATWTGGAVAHTTSNAANDGNILRVYGINSDGEPDSEDFTLAAAGVTGTKHWFRITGAWNMTAATAVGNTTVFEGGNTAITLAFATSDRSKGLRSTGITTPNLGNMPVAGRPITMVASAPTTDPIVLRGLDAGGAAQTEVVTLAGAVNVTGSKSWSAITQIEIGGIVGPLTVTLGPAGSRIVAGDARATATTIVATRAALTGTYTGAFVSGNRARLVSSAGGDVGIPVTVYGLSVAGAYQTETISTSPVLGTTAVFGTLTWSKIYYATTTTYAAGNLTISDEVPTTAQQIVIGRLTSGLLAGSTAGYYALNLPVANTTVSVVASGATVRTVLLVGLDVLGATQRESVTLTGAVAVVSTGSWSQLTGVYTGDLEAARTLTVTASLAVSGGNDTLSEVADLFNALDGFTCNATSDAPATDVIGNLDYPTVASYGSALPLSVLGVVVDLYAKLEELIRTVNAVSRYVALVRLDGATGLPTNTGAPVYLAGGSEGVALYAHWLAALNTAKLNDEIRTIVPLTANASVHAALISHLEDRGRTLKREADGKVGLAAGRTKAQIKADAKLLNTRHVQACAQEIKRYSPDGVATWYPPYAAAVLAAGMQAGMGVGTPVTRKYVNADDVRQDASWNPVEDGDAMIEAGVLVVEERTGIGFRWLRGVTSFLQNDTDLSSIEASTNDAVNVFVRNFREWLDTKIGDVNFAGTRVAVKSLCVQGLDYAVSEGWLTNWRYLTLISIGDQIKVSVDVAPVVPFNFCPINIHLYQETVTL